jgi:hypothetical protein
MGINKKGQLTIFIIVAILIVVGILSAIWLMGRSDTEITPVNLNPEQFVKKCVQDAVEDSLEIILKNGGVRNPVQTITYLNVEYNYLCYQEDYYGNCINTHPMLENLIEKEIREYTKDPVRECFDSMREDLESKGFDVTGGATKYVIDLIPGEIEIILRKEVDITRGESSERFSNFDTSINTPLYWLTMIARDIINDEATDCNVNYDDFVLFYPQYKISKANYDFSEIYFIEDRNTGAEFKFAVRGCAFAPGI